MRRNRESIAGVVKDAYLRILPIQILGIVVNAVNVFVDGVITGQFLGTTAMAAIGKKKIITTFSTAASFLILFSFVFTTCILMFSGELSELLGANEDTKTLLVDYMRGYAPGILGQVVSGTLMFMLPYNNDTKRSYIGICLMFTVNLLLDIIVVVCFGMGTFGRNGVWLAFPAVEIVAIVIIGISVFLEAGQVTFRLEDWMKLPKDFGAKDSDCLEMSLFGMVYSNNAGINSVLIKIKTGVKE